MKNITPATIFTAEDKQKIVKAIESAEKDTSGEIRLHIESHCPTDVLDHAAWLFKKMEMHKTALRNGVLFYVAIEDHKFAILGDAGINAVVPKDFWEQIKTAVIAEFAQDRYCDGLCAGIAMAGEQLKAFFPYSKNDVNELSDEISFGK